jgi:predicted membrane-bound spermidine synthase
MNWSKHNKILLALSFIEGGSLMACELLSAKMLAPYFGSSIFVWSAVLGVTLASLALGYYQGGSLSLHEKRDKIVLTVLIAAGLFLMLLPFTAQFVLGYAHLFSFRQGVILAALIIILPPVTCMGMVSPLMVSNLDHSIESAGKRAGIIYTISTTGGILFTFLYGFYVIPKFGLIIPSILTGFVLGLIPAVLIFKHGWKKPGIFGMIFLLTISGAYILKQANQEEFKVLFQEEGILGQVLVAELPVKRNDSIQTERTLFVNRIIQTSYNPENGKFNDFDYFNSVSDVLDSLQNNSRVLILGLGGGVLARDAFQKGMLVDAVEIDQRIIDVSRSYFNLEEKINVIRDDARHFLNTCTKKYDLILFDLFRGEETPAHVFTAESIEQTMQILNPGGIILINANGYYKGEIGKGTRSLYKTMRAMGLYVELYPTDTVEERSNMIYVASNSIGVYDEKIPLYMQQRFIPHDSLHVEDAIVLTDRRPILDHLNQEATLRWRIAYQAYNRSLNKSHLPLFN